MKKINAFLMMMAVAAAALLAGSMRAEAASSGGYTVSGTKIQVKGESGADIAANLNAALKYAHNLDEEDGSDTVYTVTVPAGTYKLTTGLHIYSNTTLSMEGATIQWTGGETGNMLATGTVAESEAGKGGYDDYKNITLTGGTWIGSADNTSSLFHMAHGTNFVMKNFTIKGGGCKHQVELAAINGLLVQGVTFCDKDKTTDKVGRKQESLQLDIPCATSVFRGVVLDGTPMKNVTVTGCTFRNVQRGVGTHTQLVGVYHENIKITNNTFENLDQEAIVALNYVNCEISGNVLKNCGSGISFEYGKPNSSAVYTTIQDGKKTVKGKVIHNAKSVIRDNQITVTEKKESDLVGWELPDDVNGIKVRGVSETGKRVGGDGKKIPKQNLYVSGVTVTGNTMTVCQYGIVMMDARDCTVGDNTIKSSITKRTSKNMVYDGVFVQDASKKIAVTGNKISNMPRNGIMVMKKSSVSKISGNTITDSAKCGINFWSNCTSNGNISSNTIKNSGSHGIFLSTGCEVGSISDNTINDADGNGVYLWNSCKCGEISGNTITKTEWAVYLNKKSSGSFGYNTMKKNKNNKYRVTKSKTLASGNLGKVTSVKLSSKTKKQIQVTFSKGKAAKVQIRYSTKKDFSSGVKTVTVKKGTKTVLKKLKSGKTYYVQARACGSLNGMKLYGPYSKSVKIKCK